MNLAAIIIGTILALGGLAFIAIVGSCMVSGRSKRTEVNNERLSNVGD